jgi:hypothetical protein
MPEVLELGTTLDIAEFHNWLALSLITAAFWIKLNRRKGSARSQEDEELKLNRANRGDD